MCNNCENNTTNCGCTTTENCVQQDCSCPIKDFPTDCIQYTGEDLECSGIKAGTILTDLIVQLDTFICEKFDFATTFFQLINVGSGAEIYKGDTVLGQKEIRTLSSPNPYLLKLNQDTNEIQLESGLPTISLDGNEITLSVSNSEGSIDTSTVDLTPSIGDDVHINLLSWSSATGILTVGLTDTTSLNIELTNAVNVKSDVLETDNNEDSFIENKNPTKTEVLGVAGVYAVSGNDNNYVIEIDNGVNDVTINLAGIPNTDNFFVGFVQKGTGLVTFTGYDIKPEGLTDELYGQGHIASLEIINSTKYLAGTFKASI